ncbi:MAG: GSCFA domain-containing protein [Bacteroidota bacterium]|nr:GSCFA domain-containing protein [Bacteroidota bacterium]
MHPYFLNLKTEDLKIKIHYEDLLLFSGSCFSENIATRLQSLMFDVYAQPNGTIFNPISIAEPITRIINYQVYDENAIIQRDDLFFSKFHHGSFYAKDSSDLIKEINESLHLFETKLQKAKFLFLTFGSAFVYELTDSQEIVANCHKLPQNRFSKRLLSIQEIEAVYQPILKHLADVNPDLNVVLTVSPVKHLKDGIVENQLSKSTLLLAIHQLKSTNPNVSYFPAYELVTDDLRDYRFYENDGAHPNQLAIDYVFEKFKSTYFSEETRVYFDEQLNFQKLKNHKPIQEQGNAYEAWIKQVKEVKEKLNDKYSKKPIIRIY